MFKRLFRRKKSATVTKQQESLIGFHLDADEDSDIMRWVKAVYAMPAESRDLRITLLNYFSLAEESRLWIDRAMWASWADDDLLERAMRPLRIIDSIIRDIKDVKGNMPLIVIILTEVFEALTAHPGAEEVSRIRLGVLGNGTLMPKGTCWDNIASDIAHLGSLELVEALYGMKPGTLTQAEAAV